MYKLILNQVIKLFSKRIAFLAVGVLIGMSTSAQTTAIDSANYVQPFSKTSAFRTWSIGINGGLLVPFNEDFQGANYRQPGFGFYVKNQILSTIGLQADFFGGQAIGYNSYDNSLSQYRTRTVSAALSLYVTLANINWRHKKSVIQPYFTGGYGYMAYQPVITTEAAPGSEVTSLYKQPGNGIIKSFFVPVGVGLKINVSNTISVDLGYSVSLINADDFDGLIFGTRNDEISYIHAGLEFAIGNHQKPQLATHNPVNSMRTEYLKIERLLIIRINAQNAQIDALKNEVTTKTELINNANASLLKFTTDSDGDGVPDLFDKCPGTPAGTIIDGSGCPLVFPAVTVPAPKQLEIVKATVTEQEKKVIKDAVDNLQFDFDKATIREVSFETLDKLAKLLVERRLNLRLSGYTDNMGPDAVNLKLSIDRAEAVKTYLVSKGVNPSKIEANGFGKENPIASNNTLEGRTLNRRVEFTVY